MKIEKNHSFEEFRFTCEGHDHVKTIGNAVIFIFLMALVLTSCNESIPPSAMTTAEVRVTATPTAPPTRTETPLAIPTASLTAWSSPTPSPFPPTQVPFFTFPVDRHDPESVIRAYFDARERSDTSAMASVLSSKFGRNFILQPLDWIEIVEIELISDSSPTERIYSVFYNVQWTDQKDPSPTRWRFRLTWDADRDSWIIIGYGSGG